MPSSRIQFRAPKSLEEELSRRSEYFGGSKTEAIRTDLLRYRRLLRETKGRLASEGVFTGEEQALILDALNGSLTGEYPGMIAASIMDSIHLDGTGEKWGVAPGVMREKLAALTPLECAAVADAAEEFWSLPNNWNPEGGMFGTHGDTPKNGEESK